MAADPPSALAAQGPLPAARDGKRARKVDWPWRLCFAACLAPLLWLAGRAALGDLGADPIAEVLNRLGLYTLSILLGSLACTPLQILFGWKWPVRVRRMVGLWAFAYASLHLFTYAFVDQSLDFAAIGKDIAKRKFITIGFAAFLVLLALAITTPQRMVRKLGFRWWKRLHRLVYAAGVLGCIHFLWRFKLKEPQPIAYGIVLLVLLGIRAIDWARKRTRPARIRASPSSAGSV
jgi:sulfoxide reductase heme-binding subunit YedZ